MNIKSCNTTVMVTNLDTAIQFYTEALGMTLKNRYGNHWADIEGPGISIGLHPTSAPVNRGNNLQIALGVPDLEAAIKELEQKGVSFTRNDEDQVRLASFTDPDGNALYLVQPQW